MVRVRHASGYQTAYLHLSAFAPGIRVGSRLSQGDLVGKVGSSGTATGPHLDYRIIRNGAYVDPIAELKRMPKGEPIDPARLDDFNRIRDTAFEELTALAAAAAARRPVQPAPSR
jgi:murein DD-endopeptidase MepM/ murein hydrolase activator NlpD